MSTFNKNVSLSEFSGMLKEFGDEIIKEEKDAVYEGLMDSLPKLKEMTPEDTGKLKESWGVRKDADGEGVKIGNTAPYASIQLEYGADHTKPRHIFSKEVVGDEGITMKNISEKLDKL